MKKILKSILSILCLVAIICSGGENPDGSCCFPWTLCWLAVAFLAGLSLNLVIANNKSK